MLASPEELKKLNTILELQPETEERPVVCIFSDPLGTLTSTSTSTSTTTSLLFKVYILQGPEALALPERPLRRHKFSDNSFSSKYEACSQLPFLLQSGLPELLLFLPKSIPGPTTTFLD